MVYMSLVVNLIGQRSRDVIGRSSVSRDVINFTEKKKTYIYRTNQGLKGLTTTNHMFSFQHVVMKVVLGTKTITRFRSSLKEFMTYASENVSLTIIIPTYM